MHIDSFKVKEKTTLNLHEKKENEHIFLLFTLILYPVLIYPTFLQLYAKFINYSPMESLKRFKTYMSINKLLIEVTDLRHNKQDI